MGKEFNVKYDPIYAKQIKRHMANGYSLSSFTAISKVDRSTLYEWLEKHDDFRESHDMGQSQWLMTLELAQKTLTLGQNPVEKYLDDDGSFDLEMIEDEHEREAIKEEIERFRSIRKVNGPQLRFALESRYRKEYSKRVELANPDGSNVGGGQVVVLKIPDNGRG